MNLPVKYLTNSHKISEIKQEFDPPRYGRNQQGYGRKIPTHYRLRIDNRGPWRRVYATCNSNIACFYVVVSGLQYWLHDYDLD